MKAKAAIAGTLLALILAGSAVAQEEFDFGDAPDPGFPTLLANNGARHLVSIGSQHIFLGLAPVDTEPDGQPHINAIGDDNDIAYPPPFDDEDGVSWDTPLIPGQVAQITVTASVNGDLDAWIDFSGNNDWTTVGDQIFTTQPLIAGANTLNFNVPVWASPGYTYARFRFNASGVALQHVGPAPDGEVEDYFIQITQELEDFYDWGDAPDSASSPKYPTLAANNGANHLINASVYLGAVVDIDLDGQPHAKALGDDINQAYPGSPYPPGDEDGIAFTSLLVQNQTATLTATASTAGYLDAWIDYNQDGVWNAAEKIFSSTPLGAGANALSVTIPGGATAGKTFARFRFSLNGGLAPNGTAPDGEVEDYEVWIETTEEDHKMHWPQYPDPHGWDVRASYLDGNPDDQFHKVLADDFLCTSNGPITKITFWGSFQYNGYIPTNFHKFNGISKFHFSFHKDIPVDLPEIPYSRPVVPAEWEIDVDPFMLPAGWEITVTTEEPSWQGWYDPNTGNWNTNDHNHYFRYDITIPEADAFVQVESNIYWLDISVDLEGMEGYWGWKTSRSPHWNDDAVWADLPVEFHQQWGELIDPIYSNSLDLAFIINDEVEPEETYDWGDAPDQPYPTLAASSGANHLIVPGVFMGTLIDAETDGQPNATATGDDLAGPAADDEDGVVFNTPLFPGQPALIDVTVSQAGWLDVWLDADNNGDWLGPNDLVYSAYVSAGLNPLSINIPLSVPPGQNFMRFRYNTNGPLPPTGGAQNGEVEDYEVDIELEPELDFGDAPDPGYPTWLAMNGARHIIYGGPAIALRMGAKVDADPDGQPTAASDGDDTDGSDDEESIVFTTPIIPGTWAKMDLTVGVGIPASGYAWLQGWADFNNDGDWLDAGEQIFADELVTFGASGSGVNNLSFPVPTTALPGALHLRLRLSTYKGIGITGLAYDGEVEDYLVHVEEPMDIDWGDAFDNWITPVYPTILLNNGAHHVIDGVHFLGGQIDAEADGQPAIAVDGDDIVGPSPDDEDGVFFTTMIFAGGYVGVDVDASTNGVLDAWVDFNNDGDWDDLNEQIFSGQNLHPGINSLGFTVPASAATVYPITSRFRFTSGGISTYTGLAMDGEVEDHALDIQAVDTNGLDFGDADIFPETVLPNGARHAIVPGIVLGSAIDWEPDGQPSAADMDDMNGLDDEDGVVFNNLLIAGSSGSIDVMAGSAGGQLDAWIDYGNDFSFVGDHLWGGTSHPLLPGLNAGLTFTIPAPPLAIGPVFARFRISSGGGLAPTGLATDGEVEDYLVELFQPAPTVPLKITNLTFNASCTTSTVEWTVQSGITYELESTTNLVTGPWMYVPGNPVIGPANSLTDNMSAETSKFYRVRAPYTP